MGGSCSELKKVSNRTRSRCFWRNFRWKNIGCLCST